MVAIHSSRLKKTYKAAVERPCWQGWGGPAPAARLEHLVQQNLQLLAVGQGGVAWLKGGVLF